MRFPTVFRQPQTVVCVCLSSPQANTINIPVGRVVKHSSSVVFQDVGFSKATPRGGEV